MAAKLLSGQGPAYGHANVHANVVAAAVWMHVDAAADGMSSTGHLLACPANRLGEAQLAPPHKSQLPRGAHGTQSYNTA